MENKKKLPKGLAKRQELQRQETVNKVLRATADIKDEGRKVTVAALVEFTGLSRSTFAKPHIRELLVEHGYAQGNIEVLSPKHKKASLSENGSEKDRLVAELRDKNAELQKECELLRGRLFLMMEKVKYKT